MTILYWSDCYPVSVENRIDHFRGPVRLGGLEVGSRRGPVNDELELTSHC